MYGLRVRGVSSLVLLSFLTVSCWYQQMPPLATQASPSMQRRSATRPPPVKARSTACTSGAVLDLDCAAFPNTDVQFQPEWDYFAWNTFIAANWPAIDPARNSEQRGIPDLTKSFVNAPPDALLTWETYKEKREVFYPPPAPGGTTQSPGVWNQAPRYGPADGPPIPMCSNTAESAGHRRRVLLQAGKIPQGAAETFNSLDETAEVPSQALETEAELCAGVQNPQCYGDNPNACCGVRNSPVMPRVWKGRPAAQPVLYEVKVNYDFFQYVTANKYYIDLTAAQAAKAGNIALPYRTSAATSPTRQQNPPSVYGYLAGQAVQSYQNVSPTSTKTPYPSGAIHLKAAWILLKDEDKSKYHTTRAAYFQTEAGKLCMATGTFGLVGLHIIQRIHRSYAENAFSQGGTFVFATWEHVDNPKSGFTYSNIYRRPPNIVPTTRSSAATPATGFYPSLIATLPVRRLFPILPGTQNVNKNVHQAIAAVNPKSVWLNYELIGVQFQPVHVPVPGTLTPNLNDPTNIGQPLFLANSVIETNAGLQYFQGLPPGEVPIPNFAKNGIRPNTLDPPAFDRNLANVSFNGTAYNMGGCMGCHGVAQLRGYSFSFVLLLGQRGAAVETQELPIPPAQPPNPSSP